jgi:hypothetical protein
MVASVERTASQHLPDGAKGVLGLLFLGISPPQQNPDLPVRTSGRGLMPQPQDVAHSVKSGAK